MLQHGTKGNWKKYINNPVLGGKYGTCFDIAVLDEGTEIAMYFSWRPRKKRRGCKEYGRHSLVGTGNLYWA